MPMKFYCGNIVFLTIMIGRFIGRKFVCNNFSKIL
nr:MAG TPA: hypothetical protein [Caudoviricetes sp.]